jgi:peptide/nickel transport system substrate-binding protein/oligopeptide transport system substrate-binding protein
VLATVCALAAPFTAVAQTGGARAETSVYRRPLGHDPATLDPARISDVYSRSVANQIFDGLVEFDHTLTITPALAQFWKATRDGITWTFMLRKGVTFHHGREVTADDVVFSLTRILDPRLKSSSADVFMVIKGAREFATGKATGVSGLTAVDASTVRITLEEAFGPFVSILAMGTAKIVPRDLVERQAEGFGLNPVGTGPFKLAQWERGQRIALVRNADYYGGPPRLGRLVYQIFEGERTTLMYEQFRAGELEDTPIPTPEHGRIPAGYQHVKRPMFNLRHYGFNTRLKPFDDRRVRQAVVAAINRPALLEDIFRGRFIPAHGVLPPGTLSFNPAVKGIPYDPALARQLLKEAGYPEGRGLPPATFWSSVKSDRIVREHAAMQEALKAVGITADFKYQTDWPAFSKLLAEGKCQAFLHAWYADIPDPDNFLHLLFHSKSPRNYMRYANAAIDDMLTHARNEADLPRRVDLYRRAEQIILADAPVLPVWHYPYERLFQPYVRSVEVNGLGDPYIPLRKIWLERP